MLVKYSSPLSAFRFRIGQRISHPRLRRVPATDMLVREVIREFTRGRVNLERDDVRRFNYWECRDAEGHSIRREEWRGLRDALLSAVE